MSCHPNRLSMLQSPWLASSPCTGAAAAEKSAVLAVPCPKPTPLGLPHLRGHHCNLLGGDGPAQHVLFQLGIFGVLQIGDAAPHTVFVLHVSVLDVLVYAYGAVKDFPANPEASKHILHLQGALLLPGHRPRCWKQKAGSALGNSHCV